MISPGDLSYILGNPPFVGKQHQSPGQKAEMEAIFDGVPGAGVLDYVTCWYRRASDYMVENPRIRAAFVSTNSITQGEQVGVLWPTLFSRGVRINFAHRTFQWTSEARGTAGVHCVIIGFALQDETEKWIYDYETPRSEPHAIVASNINSYLVDAPSIFLDKRRTPLCEGVPEMAFGNMPNDGGHLLLSSEEKSELLTHEPEAARWIRPLIGSEEFINKIERWCLWLVGVTPSQLRRMPRVMERIEAVRKKRLESRRATTRRLAATPMLFGEIRQPRCQYLAIPEVSSESRNFIPLDFLEETVIPTNKIYTISGASNLHLGVLSSTMHMAWTRAVCGRMKSDYQYSAGIVYNNFPWPSASDAQKDAISLAAQGILSARAEYSDSSLADLYDPVAMPPELVRAHADLDRAVDRAYGRTTFTSEMERVAFLFERYEALNRPLIPPTRPRRGRRSGAGRTTSSRRQRGA